MTSPEPGSISCPACTSLVSKRTSRRPSEEALVGMVAGPRPRTQRPQRGRHAVDLLLGVVDREGQPDRAEQAEGVEEPVGAVDTAADGDSVRVQVAADV